MADYPLREQSADPIDVVEATRSPTVVRTAEPAAGPSHFKIGERNVKATLRGPVLPGVILLGSSLAISLFFWPGYLDADALQQINQAKTGVFTDWYAPILDWFWRPLFLLHISPGFVLWLTIATFMLSVYELLRIAWNRWPAVAVTLLLTLFPPVLGFLGSLTRDTWFGACTFGAYALLARSMRFSGRARTVLAILALIAVWIALAARQNAAPAVIPAVFIAVGTLLRAARSSMAGRQERQEHLKNAGKGPKRQAISCTIGSLLVLALFVLSQWFLTYNVIGAGRSYPEQHLLDWDLASLSLRSGKVLLPRSVFPSQNLKLLGEHYSPYTFVPLLAGPNHPLVWVTNGSVDSVLRHDWIDAVRKYPLGYLRVRWVVWTRQLGWSGNVYEPYHDGYDPNLWHYRASFPGLDRFALAYLGSFRNGPYPAGGPLNRVWPYLIVGTCVGLDLLRRDRKELRLVGWLCCFAVLYYLPYFFLAAGQVFRYAWFLVAATLIGLLVDVADRWRRGIERRAHEIYGNKVRSGSMDGALQR